jgi:4-aminobutyrate aminotransferase-like enzyme
MARKNAKPLRSLLESDSVREAAEALLDAVEKASQDRDLSPKQYEKTLRDLERLRGQPLAFPMLAAGTGRGARMVAADGTLKLDFVAGLGVHAFGHGDRDLRAHALAAAAADTQLQGHLMPGPEYLRLSRALLQHAGPRLKHAWLALSGTMANENALKMIYQKRSPADLLVCFENAFHGRSLAMSELSDRPAYRRGLPQTGRVLQVPFYAEADPDSTQRTLDALEAHLRRHPGRIAGMCFELVQGEGGFNTAPRTFFAALMARCQEAGLAVWVDEVQTFARTGELFSFRTLDLEEWVDVVTVGKILHGSATLSTRDYNPEPGLVAGTFAGSTAAMAVGARIIERLEEEGYLGAEGRIVVLGQRIERRFQSLARRVPKAIGARSGVGAMQAFVPWHGSEEIARAVLEACFEEGLILLQAGHAPTKLRMLPPLNTTDEELEAAFGILEKALRRVAEDRELPC